VDADDDALEGLQEILALVPRRRQRGLDAQDAAVVQGVADADAFDVEEVADHEGGERFLLAEVAEEAVVDVVAVQAEAQSEEIAAAADVADEIGIAGLEIQQRVLEALA